MALIVPIFVGGGPHPNASSSRFSALRRLHAARGVGTEGAAMPVIGFLSEGLSHVALKAKYFYPGLRLISN
jgi:hypothetical protein